MAPAGAPPAAAAAAALGDLAQFLATQGLSRLLPLFEEEEVFTVGDLALVTDADLRAMGVALGPRKRLLHSLASAGMSAV